MPELSGLNALSRLGVIVVHFHQEHDVAAVVRSVIDAGVPADQVIVADNGSDEFVLTQALAHAHVTPQVRTLPNVGYAGAVNSCLPQLPVDVEVVCVLTHEVELAADCLSQLLRVLDERPEVGLVGPLLFEQREDAAPRVWSAGGTYIPILKVPTHRHHLVSGELPKPLEPRCRWLDGAVLMLRRSTLESLGGLDTRYFLYHEDVDLGWRVEQLGLQVWMVENARATQRSGGHLNAFLSTRNMTMLLRSHRQRTAALLWGAQAMLRVTLAQLPPRRAERISEAGERWAGLRAGIAGEGGRPPRRYWP